MQGTTNIILTEDHPALGRKGSVIAMPNANVSAWIDSKKAKLETPLKEEKAEKSKKKVSKKD